MLNCLMKLVVTSSENAFHPRKSTRVGIHMALSILCEERQLKKVAQYNI